MPALWTETIATHRNEVREAILGAAARIVGEAGFLALTMSGVAERAGIGRATLYKYFPDVEAILVAWHERQIGAHLAELTALKNRLDLKPTERLKRILETYAVLSQRHHGNEVAALLHRGAHAARADERLTGLVRDLLVEGVRRGEIRTDVAVGELASFCLSALGAAVTLSSKAAQRRLVGVVLDGVRERAARRVTS